MSDQNNCTPETVEECNLALKAMTSKVVEHLNLESKILIQGQEDILTLSEYEALFAADMTICENALDVILDLARKQKAYLESLVAVRNFERSVPSAMANALKQAATESNKALDLRKRLKEGEYSFFVSAYAKSDGNATSATSRIPLNTASDLATTSTIADHPKEFENRILSNASTAFSTSILGNEPSFPFKPRERPQFSSDAARRILSALESHEKVSEKAESKSAQQQQNSTKGTTQDYSVDRRCHAETINGKQISSSGGCSLDGSLIVDGVESSDQNGLRTFSPVRVPPQPNFDDSDLESFCEVSSKPPNLPKIGNESALAGDPKKKVTFDCPPSVLKTIENTSVPVQSEESKPLLSSVLNPIWLSSTYQPPQRPKFTSSIGRMYNQE
ncbi:hypothetical protein V3C99_002423 [Haemonchus contortus]